MLAVTQTLGNAEAGRAGGGVGGKTVCVKPRDGAHDKPSREESEKEEQNAVGAKPWETREASERPSKGGATSEGGEEVVSAVHLLRGPST